MGKEYHVAVVGATGAVGTRMIELLAETSLPIASVRLLASKRSAGQEIQFKGQPLIVEELVPESFEGIDLALFSAGGVFPKSLRQKQLSAELLLLTTLAILEWQKMFL